MTHYIYLHGFASGPSSFKAKRFAREFKKRGIKIHIPDLNGDDFSRMTVTGQLDTLYGISDDLKGDLVLIGSSLGGYVASLYAAQDRRVKKLFLMAPAFHFFERQKKRLGKEKLREWRNSGSMSVFHHAFQREMEISYDIVRDQKNYGKNHPLRDISTFIIHGVNDDVVPFQLSVEHVRSYPQSQLLLLNDDHSLNGSIELIMKQAISFLGLESSK